MRKHFVRVVSDGCLFIRYHGAVDRVVGQVGMTSSMCEIMTQTRAFPVYVPRCVSEVIGARDPWAFRGWTERYCSLSTHHILCSLS